MNCQICGTFVATSRVACNNCGSRVSPETGNAFSAQKLFTRGITVSLVSIGVLVLAITGVSFANGANAVAVLVASAQQSLGNYGDLEDASSLLPETDESESFEPDNSDPLDGDTGLDSSDTTGIPDDLVADGYVLGDDGLLAWRWANENEKATVSCSSDSTTCTWVSVYSLQACPAVLINGHVSLSASTDTAEETVVATSESNSADRWASVDMQAYETRLIELDGYGDYSGKETWLYLTSLTCELNGIGHD